MASSLPYFRLQHCAASRQKQEASNRISCFFSARRQPARRILRLCPRTSFRNQVIRETRVRIEAHHFHGIGPKIRKLIEVVAEQPPGRNVYDRLYPSALNTRASNDGPNFSSDA